MSTLARARVGCGCGGPLLRRLAAVPSGSEAAPTSLRGARSPLLAPRLASSLFHTSAPRPARRRRRFNSVPAAQLGLVDEASIGAFAKSKFPGYTSEEKEALRAKYTPAQMAAVEAGEAAVDARDLTVQGRLRIDQANTGLTYLDDFSQVKPVVDKRAKPSTKAEDGVPVAFDSRFMDEDAFAADTVRWLESFVPKDVNLDGLTDEQLREVTDQYGPKDEDLLKWWFERPALVGRDGKTPVSDAAMGGSGLAPSLGAQIPGVTSLYTRQQDPEDRGLDETGEYKDLKRKTGLMVQESIALITKVLVVRFVHNQTRLGKVRSSSVVVIAGNGNGRLGLGMAKSTEHSTAVAKAKVQAIQNMQPIPRYEDRTIYGNIETKISGTVVRLSARPPGFGLRVPHRIFEMARAAGISDLAAKIPRSRNPMNTVKATFQALVSQRDPEQIAIGRGRKLVDVRKVYYGGAVY